MKRFILVYEGENIFKDQRSFKSKKYANKKAQGYREYNRAMNSAGPNPTVEEIEVETDIEKRDRLIKMVYDYENQFENDDHKLWSVWLKEVKDLYDIK